MNSVTLRYLFQLIARRYHGGCNKGTLQESESVFSFHFVLLATKFESSDLVASTFTH